MDANERKVLRDILIKGFLTSAFAKASARFGLQLYTATNSINYNSAGGFNTDRVLGPRHSTCKQVAEGVLRFIEEAGAFSAFAG